MARIIYHANETLSDNGTQGTIHAYRTALYVQWIAYRKITELVEKDGDRREKSLHTVMSITGTLITTY